MADKLDLKHAGLKTTLPRLKVLAAMESSEIKHMSADDVYRVLLDDNETIGLATVYRVLTQFEDAGLVIRHHFEGEKSVFELNNHDHHDHMVCVKCGAVTEFLDNRIEALQLKVAEENGFTIQDHALTLYGICKNCT